MSKKGRIRKKGWVRKSIKDEYPIGSGPCQKRGGLGKRGESESQQKMNIQQEVGHVQKRED